MRRQQLTEAQITALLDPPTDQRELVRHYTLTAADLAAIRRCRGDHNRLGHALMLCYLRYPGRPLKARERPPRPLLLFKIRLTLFRGQSRTISPQSGTDSAMWPSCKTASGFVPSGRVRPPIWPTGCCRTRSRTTDLCISPSAPDRRPIARRARAALRPSPLSSAWRGSTPADRWALRRPTSSAGCAYAAPGGNQPELARLAAPDAGSGEADRDARSDRAPGPCPPSRP
jgi:Domain of unknown function (DUF4158)